MKFKNRFKRIVDILEKLGGASLAIGLFQGQQVGLWLGMGCLLASVLLTVEDA